MLSHSLQFSNFSWQVMQTIEVPSVDLNVSLFLNVIVKNQIQSGQVHEPNIKSAINGV